MGGGVGVGAASGGLAVPLPGILAVQVEFTSRNSLCAAGHWMEAVSQAACEL